MQVKTAQSHSGDTRVVTYKNGVKVGPTGRPIRDIPVPPPLKSHGPARIIAMCNQKGGVGKTTTTINLAASLAEYGRKVLAVDFDPQGALSAGLGIQTHDVPTIYDLLRGTVKKTKDVIQHSEIPDLDVIPANIDLSAAEVHLVNEVAREQILAGVLKQVKNDYDVIIIDCQPSLGLLTVNALTAAHGVIIPLECEFFALRGVALLIETIDKVLSPILLKDGYSKNAIFDNSINSEPIYEEALKIIIEDDTRNLDRILNVVKNNISKKDNSEEISEEIESPSLGM